MAAVFLTGVDPALFHFAEALLALALFAQLARTTKYGGFDVDPSLTRDDARVVGAAAALLALAGAWAPWWLGLPCAVAVASAIAGLSLDAVLFRIFTIELGPGGVRDVVLSVLWRELSELAYARRFLAQHRTAMLAPLAAALAATDAALGLSGFAHGAAVVGSIAVFAVAAAGARGRAAWRAWALAAGLTNVAVAQLAGGVAALVAGLAVGLVVFVGRRVRRDAPGPAGLAHFVVPRRPVNDPDFVPRPSHAALLALAPSAPSPSPLHGRLGRADVLLLTFESVGRAHLASHSRDGARTPFFDALAARGGASARHHCVCPLTNNAHVALYTSGYDDRAEGGSVAALARAGYQTAYLTAARTRDYGLRELLARAGFETVIDRDSLGDGARDTALLDAGLDRLAKARRRDRPLFLHVHASETHVPYRVVDGERFARFDSRDDRGRFYNGIEETDHVFARLVDALVERGLLARDALLVATSDHGQAFGALGYLSHGSAVVADEVVVPFALSHPALSPATVATSSHFDVLPTVLDLVGVRSEQPGFGASLFDPAQRRSPGLLLWAGHPSRTTSTHFGLVRGNEKLVLDLVLDRCLRMDPDDRDAVELTGAERAYAAALIARLAARRGVR